MSPPTHIKLPSTHEARSFVILLTVTGLNRWMDGWVSIKEMWKERMREKQSKKLA